MTRYIIKRILIIIPTLLAITFITYGMVRLAPGDYTKLKMSAGGELKEGSVSKALIEEERKLFGLDQPVYKGYFTWLGKIMVLDFGNSRKDGRPVLVRLKETVPVTMILVLLSIFIEYIISIPLGIVSAVRKDSTFDRGTSFILFILYSLPSFWVGLLLILFFSSGEYFNLFPLGGWISDWADGLPAWQRFFNIMWHLVLPVAVMTYGSFAFLSRYTRANMLEVINKQYITTAVAKGLSSRRVVFVHAFRNSLIPLVTLMSSILPALLGGNVIVESIFSIPGMGNLAFEAIGTRDLPVIMAITALTAFLTLLGILIVDIIYGVIDPRIRVER
ncbi:MAG: ABC transporter permease [Spirochaetota bacterium]